MKYLIVTRNTGEEVAWLKSNDEESIRNTMMEITENDYEVVQMFFDWLYMEPKSDYCFGFREAVIKLAEI